MVDLEPEIYDKEDAIELVDDITSVEFKDVYFTYPNTSVPVLSGISFKAEGNFLGIMGHTGAGKTTILKLLMRYYTVDSGKVLINGISIDDYTLDSVRDKIGFVSQEPFLFYGTVKDNVIYNQTADDKELQTALELARSLGVHSRIGRQFGHDGRRSWSKTIWWSASWVSLARALLKRPSLLILDEASSALDAETERRIQENLIASGNDRATIAVAHRLSTIRNADEILSMVDGAVVERGTHDDLVAAGGVYASQWTIQTGDMAGL